MLIGPSPNVIKDRCIGKAVGTAILVGLGLITACSRPLQVDVRLLANEAQENEAAFAEKYEDRALRFVGVVAGITFAHSRLVHVESTFFNGFQAWDEDIASPRALIVPDAAEKSLVVDCYFGVDERHALAQYRRGATISLICHAARYRVWNGRPVLVMNECHVDD